MKKKKKEKNELEYYFLIVPFVAWCKDIQTGNFHTQQRKKKQRVEIQHKHHIKVVAIAWNPLSKRLTRNVSMCVENIFVAMTPRIFA